MRLDHLLSKEKECLALPSHCLVLRDLKVPDLHLENCIMPKEKAKKGSSRELHYNFARAREDQATKSIGWMPRHQEPMKDVASGEKLR